jgi:quercetin dioxygenase-like cupin family protein
MDTLWSQSAISKDEVIMRLITINPASGKQIREYESQDVVIQRLAHLNQEAHLQWISIQPGGRIGRHPAASDQLFLVVQGEGWVEGDDQQPERIFSGQAALWRVGELHQVFSEFGMVVIVVESSSLELFI